MDNYQDLDEVLADCLDRLSNGWKIGECVERYPELSDRLLPLLEVASATMRVASAAQYDCEAKQKALRRFNRAVKLQRSPRKLRPSWITWRPRVLRPLVLGISGALFASTMALGTVVAGSDSIPGDSFYWVKIKREQASLILPRSDMNKAYLHISLARNRGQEMKQLVSRHKFSEAELVADRLKRHLNESALSVGLSTPTNPIDMPLLPSGLQNLQDASDLMVRLERDGGILRVQLLKLTPDMSPTERQKLALLRRQSELVYGTFVSALKHDDSSPRGFLWMVLSSRSRYR